MPPPITATLRPRGVCWVVACCAAGVCGGGAAVGAGSLGAGRALPFRRFVTVPGFHDMAVIRQLLRSKILAAIRQFAAVQERVCRYETFVNRKIVKKKIAVHRWNVKKNALVFPTPCPRLKKRWMYTGYDVHRLARPLQFYRI